MQSSMKLKWQYNGKTIEANMGRRESGPTSQYKYLVTLNRNNITGEDTNIVGTKPFNQNPAGYSPIDWSLAKVAISELNQDAFQIQPSNSHCFSF